MPCPGMRKAGAGQMGDRLRNEYGGIERQAREREIKELRDLPEIEGGPWDGDGVVAVACQLIVPRAVTDHPDAVRAIVWVAVERDAVLLTGFTCQDCAGQEGKACGWKRRASNGYSSRGCSRLLASTSTRDVVSVSPPRPSASPLLIRGPVDRVSSQFSQPRPSLVLHDLHSSTSVSCRS